ncbi:MAG: pantoate--beta-alanine ligase [Vulcanimicrobiaceae bacterium]
MLVATTIEQAEALLENLARPLGFVPTMGALHAGHLALIEAARRDCASVACSVFVNPMQFGPAEDLERYPRDLEGDREKLQEGGVEFLFAPGEAQMYPPGFSTAVEVAPMGTTFEGAIRPGHFRGVATVVAKLLAIMRPDVLFLGQKDAQQATLVRRMVLDLALPVDVRIVPTVRESDGLALSSRNRYLSPQERAAAPSLYAALTALRLLLHQGVAKPSAIDQAQAILSPLAKWEYLDVVSAESFQPLPALRPPAFIIGAARFERTRLLDNLWIVS